VPDALNRKHQLKVVYVGKTEHQKEVRLVSRHDKFAKEMRQNIQNGVKPHFHLQNGLLWYKQNRLYVPKRNVMTGHLRAMVVQSAPQHSSRNPTIGPT
jgi:ketopantoate reductase